MKRAPECLLHLAGPNESETFPEQGELLSYESTTISSRNGMASVESISKAEALCVGLRAAYSS
jgi:hypothetical protein